MDKRINGLAGALREIAEQRDNRLRKAEAISADRVKQLQAFLAAEFPVEAALNAAARQRDESLSVAEPALPLAVHAALRDQVRSARAAANPWWPEALRLRGAYQKAALVAAAIIITSAVLHFAHTSKPVARSVNQSPASSIFDQNAELLSRDWPFERSADRLTLRVSRLELASLDPSSFTINRALLDLDQPGRVLSLDLPIKQIRLDVEAVRTP